MASKETVHAVGKRKSSVARVYMKPGKGDIVVNHKNYADFFGRATSQLLIKQPLVLTEQEGKWDIFLNVRGGGPSGQAGAARHAISRALNNALPELRSTLKKAGLLTRDARKVERKKAGIRGARRSFQFSKR